MTKPPPAGALIALAAALFLPLGAQGWWFDHPIALLATLPAWWTALTLARAMQGSLRNGMAINLATIAASAAPLIILHNGAAGHGAIGLWLYLLALLLLAWRGLGLLAASRVSAAADQRFIAVATPFFFGLGILYLWEVLVRGFGVPAVLLPAPSQIGLRIATSLPTLAADFNQTYIKAVIPGFIMGCGAGFLTAILCDRVDFLRRGLLPIGNLVSALPIIGIAPIMVMWFGFDWHSKAAVVVVMTFFPMLVNTVTGLAATSRIERDLLATYGASRVQSLLKLRLPQAMPFIFNALKINATLALIGAIVAEFFGTPIVGMGFRISTEIGRMNVDLVWATIAVAALAGSAAYGLIVLLERRVTFWHPSIRAAG